jgi:hypothetical protein
MRAPRVCVQRCRRCCRRYIRNIEERPRDSLNHMHVSLHAGTHQWVLIHKLNESAEDKLRTVAHVVHEQMATTYTTIETAQEIRKLLSRLLGHRTFCTTYLVLSRMWMFGHRTVMSLYEYTAVAGVTGSDKSAQDAVGGGLVSDNEDAYTRRRNRQVTWSSSCESTVVAIFSRSVTYLSTVQGATVYRLKPLQTVS